MPRPYRVPKVPTIAELEAFRESCLKDLMVAEGEYKRAETLLCNAKLKFNREQYAKQEAKRQQEERNAAQQQTKQSEVAASAPDDVAAVHSQ